MKLKALIFDVDGTLADNEEVHRRAFNSAFEEHGLNWHWSRPDYAQLLATAGGKERLAAHIDSLDLAGTERAALKERISAIHNSKTTHYTRNVAGGEVPLRDGILRLVEEASSARIPLAIASATTLANIEALLRTHLGEDALQRFAVIGCDDQVPHKKPAPDIYVWVLRQLKVSAADCVAIEDSNNGVRAAKAAGIFTIVTPSYWTRNEDFSAADLVLPTLGSQTRPLPQRAAQMMGNGVVGLREIDRQLRGESDGSAGKNHN